MLAGSASRLFARHGYDGTSTRAIAEGAGVNIALILYHFGSKEGLLAALMENWVNDVLVRMRVTSEVPDEGAARTTAVIDSFLRYAIVEAPEFGAIIARESIVLEETPASAVIGKALGRVIQFFQSHRAITGDAPAEVHLSQLIGIVGAAVAMPSIAKSESPQLALAQARRWAFELRGSHARHSLEPTATTGPAAEIRPGFSKTEASGFDFLD